MFLDFVLVNDPIEGASHSVIPIFNGSRFDSGYWHWQSTTTMKRCRRSSDSDVRSVDRFWEVAHAVSLSLYYEVIFFAAYPATVLCCNVFVRVAFFGGDRGWFTVNERLVEILQPELGRTSFSAIASDVRWAACVERLRWCPVLSMSTGTGKGQR